MGSVLSIILACVVINCAQVGIAEQHSSQAQATDHKNYWQTVRERKNLLIQQDKVSTAESSARNRRQATAELSKFNINLKQLSKLFQEKPDVENEIYEAGPRGTAAVYEGTSTTQQINFEPGWYYYEGGVDANLKRFGKIDNQLLNEAWREGYRWTKIDISYCNGFKLATATKATKCHVLFDYKAEGSGIYADQHSWLGNYIVLITHIPGVYPYGRRRLLKPSVLKTRYQN